MVRVLSLTPYVFLPAKNGGQKNIDLFNKYLSQHVDFICATVDGNANELADCYETITLFSSSKTRYINFLNFFRIRKLILSRKVTHLLIEHPYFGWLALLLKLFTPVKLIVHSHNIEALRFKTLGKWWWRILWIYEKLVHKIADYNLFITNEDKIYSIVHYGLAEAKCLVATYGIGWNAPPLEPVKQQAKLDLKKKHNIQEDEMIALFVGAFDYKPNFDAFKVIDKSICPLLKEMHLPFKILVCGPHLPLDATKNPDIIIAGFVDDVNIYFRGADVFINPVTDGGGIKTKLVEALANNTNAVSTLEGAFGIDATICNGKLLLTEDHDWVKFAEKMKDSIQIKSDITPEFYQHFYWGNIAQKVAKFISTNA